MDMITKREFLNIIDEISEKESLPKNDFQDTSIENLISEKLRKYNIKDINWELVKLNRKEELPLWRRIEELIDNTAINRFYEFVNNLENKYNLNLQDNNITDEEILNEYYIQNKDIITFLNEKGLLSDEEIEKKDLKNIEDTVKKEFETSDIDKEIENFILIFGNKYDIEYFVNKYETLSKNFKQKVQLELAEKFTKEIPDISDFIVITIKNKLKEFKQKVLKELEETEHLNLQIKNKINDIFENIEIRQNYLDAYINTPPFSNFDLDKEWKYEEIKEFIEYYEEEIEELLNIKPEIENIKVSQNIKNIIGTAVIKSLKETPKEEAFEFIEKNKDLNGFNNTKIISKSKIENKKIKEIIKNLELENGQLKEKIFIQDGDILLFENKSYLVKVSGNIMEIENVNINNNNISYKIPKYIRQLLINIGNHIFRKDKNNENLFTKIKKEKLGQGDIKKEIVKIFPEAKKLEINFEGENKIVSFNYKKFVSVMLEEINKIYNNKEKQKIVLETEDPLFELFLLNVKEALKNNKKVVLTDIRTPTELYGIFKNLDKEKAMYWEDKEEKYNVKGYMLVSTKNKKTIEKYNKEKLKEIIFEATQDEQNIEWIIEQIRKKKIIPTLEELNTIITFLKINPDIKREPEYNVYSTTHEEITELEKNYYSEVFNSERKDRNYLINEIKKLKQDFDKNDVIILGGLSGVGKDTILEMVQKIDNYNINGIDMTKAEEFIKNKIKELHNIKKKENLTYEEFLNYIIENADEKIKEGVKFFINIETLKKIYFELMEKHLRENTIYLNL